MFFQCLWVINVFSIFSCRWMPSLNRLRWPFSLYRRRILRWKLNARLLIGIHTTSPCPYNSTPGHYLLGPCLKTDNHRVTVSVSDNDSSTRQILFRLNYRHRNSKPHSLCPYSLGNHYKLPGITNTHQLRKSLGLKPNSIFLFWPKVRSSRIERTLPSGIDDEVGPPTPLPCQTNKHSTIYR